MSSEKFIPIMSPVGKENIRLFEKNEVVSIKTRNPLAEINEKSQPQNQVIIKKTYKKINKVVKTTSTSEAETKHFFYSSENIIENLGIDDDSVFLENEYSKHLPEIKKENLEKITMPEIKIIHAITDTKKAGKKIALTTKLSNRKRKFEDLEEYFNDSLYDDEYFLDNYKYILEIEHQFVFRRDSLKEHTDESYRMLVVNWLHYVHQILHLSEHTYLAAIRMFDYILITTRLSIKKYVLVGLVSLWIANKHHDVHFIKISKLISICNGNYSKLQIIQAEKEALKILKFRLNFPEPATVLFYYLKREKLENDKKIRSGAMFLLELFTLLLEFSSLTPSLLAGIALMLCIKKYKSNNLSFLEYIHCHLLDRETFLCKTKQMGLYVEKLLSCKRYCDEIFEKYLKKENASVAQDFTSE